MEPFGIKSGVENQSPKYLFLSNKFVFARDGVLQWIKVLVKWHKISSKVSYLLMNSFQLGETGLV